VIVVTVNVASVERIFNVSLITFVVVESVVVIVCHFINEIIVVASDHVVDVVFVTSIAVVIADTLDR
jgi:hypothetical protein